MEPKSLFWARLGNPNGTPNSDLQIGTADFRAKYTWAEGWSVSGNFQMGLTLPQGCHPYYS